MSFEILEDISHELRRTAAVGINMAHIILNDIEFRIDKKPSFSKNTHRSQGGGWRAGAGTDEKSGSDRKSKSLYTLLYIDSKGKDHVIVDGVKLTSRIMRVNFAKIHRVFPYSATCSR